MFCINFLQNNMFTNIFDNFLQNSSPRKSWVNSPQPHIWVRVPSLNKCENPIRAHALPTMGFTQATWAFCEVFADTANIFCAHSQCCKYFSSPLHCHWTAEAAQRKVWANLGKPQKSQIFSKYVPSWWSWLISVSTASMVWRWWWYWWYYGEYAKLSN